MRGQVTGFAIVGVLVLIAVSSLIWLSRAEPSSTVDRQVPRFEIENCLELAANDAIKEVGLRGGVASDDALRRTLTSPAQYAGLDVRQGMWSYSILDSAPWFPDEDLYYESDDLVGTVMFPRFDPPNEGESSSLPITSLVIEETIARNAETCVTSLGLGSLEIRGVGFSPDETRVDASVRETGRNERVVSVTLPVPIRRYHTAIRTGLENESSNATYRISNLIIEGGRLRLEANASGDADLLIFTSDEPVLDGEPFVYLSLINDRLPVFSKDPSDASVLDCDTATDLLTTLDTDAFIEPDDTQVADADDVAVDDCGFSNSKYTITSDSSSRVITV